MGHWAPSLFLVVHWTTRSPRGVDTGVSQRQGTLPWAPLISLCLVQWTTMGHENLCQLHVSGCLVSMHCAYVFLPVKVRLKRTDSGRTNAAVMIGTFGVAVLCVFCAFLFSEMLYRVWVWLCCWLELPTLTHLLRI